jgi:nucleoid-associated protein YgaU
VQTVQNDIKPTAAAPESKFYTVKSGDTLWAISEREYGKGHGGKYDVIFQANRPMLTHPDKIYPGQVLRIPPLS